MDRPRWPSFPCRRSATVFGVRERVDRTEYDYDQQTPAERGRSRHCFTPRQVKHIETKPNHLIAVDTKVSSFVRADVCDRTSYGASVSHTLIPDIQSLRLILGE